MQQPIRTAAIFALLCPVVAHAQMGRSQDWNTYGFDQGRTGFERSDPRLLKDTIAKELTLLYKMKLDPNARGVRSVTPPMIINTLISYRGFKELAFSGGSGNTVYAINADFGKMFWEKRLIYSSEFPQVNDSSLACNSTVVPWVSLVPAPAFNFGGRGGRGAAPPAPGPAPAPVAPGRGLGGAGFGASRPVLALANDGRLHRLNSANGDDQGGVPVRWLPPNARASMLNVADNVVYTSTNQGCGAVDNAVWAMDFAPENSVITSFKTNGGGVWGTGGVAIGPDQTIYAQLGDGPLDPAAHKWSNTLVALAPRTLELRQHFTPPDLKPAKNIGMSAATPVVFPWKDKTLVVASGKDGRVHLLDGSLAPLGKSNALSDGGGMERGIYGLTSWTEEDQSRWIAASVWGPVAGSPANTNGGIVVFKIEGDTTPELKQVGVSPNMSSPVTPVVASGMIFALSAGQYTRIAKEGYNGIATVEERPSANGRATLYALDGANGKELWSSKLQVAAPGALTGLTVANGRIYFGTTDGTFYCFGIPMEH